MSLLRSIFGPSQEEIWSQFANEIGADFINEGFWKSKKVVARFENWVVTLDTYTQSTGKTSTTYTRIRAPYVNKDGFNFKIYKSGWFSEIGKTLGMQDVEIGYAEFDEKFIIKGNDEAKLIELFSSDKIRELISSQDNIYLEVKNDEGWFGTDFPEGVDELYFQTMGVIKDIERLKSLYMLFALVLDKLCIMGSAYEEGPEITLK
ncbi:DUF3137 domain-containing protein [Tissierella sp. P1]|uniref:DUF3137 domain-containing protein n=1 Tax=Tissierella carlieri TaxID=689904 RepID=A0ABT1SEV0_9FIRM|nr:MULTISPECIES: DUF3137 domain-containing protein [Tissierella]MCQ4924497.1 hypothetical protein [Tissierella carlieri]OZV11562.1 DUF3137 domain-containing protein [Tissierella sp. P1]